MQISNAALATHSNWLNIDLLHSYIRVVVTNQNAAWLLHWKRVATNKYVRVHVSVAKPEAASHHNKPVNARVRGVQYAIYSTSGVVECLIKHEAKPSALSDTRPLLECCKS